MKTFEISPVPLSLDIINILLSNDIRVELSQEAIDRIQYCRTYLDNKLRDNKEPIYGITTGFGSLCNIQISESDLTKLQENLVMSHACGTGDEVDQDIVRLMLLLKIHALSSGNSGVQVQTVQRLIDFYNNDALPIVYELGSLGASGDLAPLAHLSLPLLGLGEMRFGGKIVPAKKVLKEFGWQPISLQSKEGLALLNGTQFMSAHAVHILLKAKRLLLLSDITGAISLEAYNGKLDPFLEQLHTIRPHKGQIDTAENFRKILNGSKHIISGGKKVQDPYSFRCIPQVHGAVKDTVNYVESVILTEINAVTDNPTVFPDQDLVLSGGNFHGEPLAFALDFISIAMAELGSIAERRIYRLISGQRELPEFLVANPGLNSGFMIPQYTAASIVSQNKQLATPSSIDTISSSNEQEDHVSMGANAATKALRIAKNVERIIAIELFTAAQALEFKGIDKTSPYLQAFISEYRRSVTFVEDDRVLYNDIEKSVKFIQSILFDFPV